MPTSYRPSFNFQTSPERSRITQRPWISPRRRLLAQQLAEYLAATCGKLYISANAPSRPSGLQMSQWDLDHAADDLHRLGYAKTRIAGNFYVVELISTFDAKGVA